MRSGAYLVASTSEEGFGSESVFAKTRGRPRHEGMTADGSLRRQTWATRPDFSSPHEISAGASPTPNYVQAFL